MTTSLKTLIAGAVLALSSAPTYAGILYAINDGDNTLVTIDTTTLAVTTVGATGVGGDFGDLAYDDSTGTMYWVAGRDNNNLYTLNLSTGAATLVGAHGIGDQFALAWNGAALYAQATNGVVYTLNTSTGAATAIGNNGVYPGGMDYNPTTGKIVALEAGSGVFYDINQSTGAATLIAGSSGYVNDNDLAFDGDQNVFWVVDWSQQLLKYDATTMALLSGTYLGDNYDGVEYVSGGSNVPEHGSLAVFALSGLALALFRRRNATK